MVLTGTVGQQIAEHVRQSAREYGAGQRAEAMRMLNLGHRGAHPASRVLNGPRNRSGIALQHSHLMTSPGEHQAAGQPAMLPPTISTEDI